MATTKSSKAQAPSSNAEEPFARTLRVRQIPIAAAQKDLDAKLRSLESNDDFLKSAVQSLDICSLAQDSEKFSTATINITIPANVSLNAVVDRMNRAIKRFKLPYVVDQSFIGVTPLGGSIDAGCDIIAVHGLASHPAGTWKSKSNNDIWIRDWIPEDIGNVRVLLYGYECGLQDSDSWSSIEDLSSMLLDNLTAYRRQFQATHRPVVFLAHSLGGLLVKEALAQSQDCGQASDQAYLHLTSVGLVFFGVPHWGIQLDNLRSITRGQPNDRLIDSIVTQNGETSPYLNSLSKRFARAFDKSKTGGIRTINVWERRETPLLVKDGDKLVWSKSERRLLVTQVSATITGSESILDMASLVFDRNHSDLNKFDLQVDTQYQSLKYRIIEMVESGSSTLEMRVKKRGASTTSNQLEDINTCLRALSFEGMSRGFDPSEDKPWQNVKSHISKDIFETEGWKGWTSSKRGLMILLGKHANELSAYSYLILHRVRELVREQNSKLAMSAMVLLFKLQERDGSEQLSGQLSGGKSPYQALVDDVKEQHDKHSGIDWSEQKLREYFIMALKEMLKHSTIWLVVDGPKHDSEASSQILDYLKMLKKNLNNSKGSFRVCVSYHQTDTRKVWNGTQWNFDKTTQQWVVWLDPKAPMKKSERFKAGVLKLIS